ncbi:hypothetical protein [Aquimarina spongiae]|uniref:Uncharacterized protein n=1 Tax=Aquimarina spongiae TaxID=570521 RepID=A0A1M6HLI2_9FLAO|nr:hypothetical protein [Aquimarina spongiae]SHJ23068.1 hypothetical protein SAMN04488508_106347 [Aquimarina spongiae]
MKKRNLNKLSLNKNIISDLQKKTLNGGNLPGSIGGTCHSDLGTCGPGESLEAFPAPCHFG